MIKRIQNWILKMRFVGDSFEEYFATQKRDLYTKAFADARKDLEETNKTDIDERAKELCKDEMHKLLSVVDVSKIVGLDKARGIVFIGGKKADDARLANLKAEAEFFLESDLWHLIQETPKELASRVMFVEGQTLADMQKGRSMLYTLSAQKNIVETFKGYIGKPQPPAPPAKP